MPRFTDCVKILRESSDLITEDQAKELLTRIDSLGRVRAKQQSISVEEALKNIAEEVVLSERTATKVQQRQHLLTIAAKRRVKDLTNRFKLPGDGIDAFLVGSSRTVQGARLSVDYQVKSRIHKYIDRLAGELEKEGLLGDFERQTFEKELWEELEQARRDDGNPGVSGSRKAAKIADIVEKITDEQFTEQNLAGAYQNRLPGWIIRQTHDTTRIRNAGGASRGAESRSTSFRVWSEDILPLLDQDKTFQGEDPIKFLRRDHDRFYTGVFHSAADEAQVDLPVMHGSLARSVSGRRVYHFKDAESARLYNEKYGSMSLHDSILEDIKYRARSAVLMENLGPNPRRTFEQILSELEAETRDKGDENVGEQVDSLRRTRTRSFFQALTGDLDRPDNVSLARLTSGITKLRALATMGRVVITSLSDTTFTHSELTALGMGNMRAALEQLRSRVGPRTQDQQAALRMMAVATDGILGNIAMRYDVEHTPFGTLSKLHEKFFKLNFLNWWTNAAKSAEAEIFSSFLAEHRHLDFNSLPPEIARTLSIYDFNQGHWDLIRQHLFEQVDGKNYILPEKIKDLPDQVLTDLIGSARSRDRIRMESMIRTMFLDRADIAVPTPGTKEKVYVTGGTKSGTIWGSAIRLLTMFKAFPVTVMTKVIGREIYRNNETLGAFLRNDHLGKFRLAQLIAVATIGGYTSGVIRDLLEGKKPKDPRKGKTITDAMLRGGGWGLFGDVVFNEYDNSYKSFTKQIAGPVFGGLIDPLANIASDSARLQLEPKDVYKFARGNTPFINLFYVKPVLDYFVLWNLESMLDPGAERRREQRIKEQFGQERFVK